MGLTRALAAALGVALLAPAGARAADWSTFGFDSARTGENPAETALAPATAPGLREVWSAPLTGVVNAQPLYAARVRLRSGRRAGLVLAADEHGALTALDATTGRRVWRRRLGALRAKCVDLPGGIYGISSTPVLQRARNRVYSADGLGRVHALDLSTGAEKPGWPVAVTPAPAREHIWGALARRGDRLYAGTSSHCSETFYRGRLVAIDARRARVGATWFSLPSGKRGGGIWGWGGAALDGRGDAYVATATVQAGPADAPNAQRVVRLSPALKLRAADRPDIPNVDDADFGATPLLFRAPGCPAQLAVLHKSGALFVYDRDRIAAGPRQTLQIGDRTQLAAYGTYAWSARARTLFVANNTPGDSPRGLLAFRVGAGCALGPLWQQPLPAGDAFMAPPVTAGGVVYLGTGTGRELLAFDAATGAPLWSSGRLGGAVYQGPAVAGGRVFAGAWDGRLHAWARLSG